MKNTLTFAICLLISVMLIAILPTDAEAAIYDDTLRLHILAPSDSAEDQALKLLIRDKVLEKYSAELGGVSSAEEGKETLEEKLSEIEYDCQKWCSDEGYTYNVTCTVTEEWYNTREYSNFTLPAGRYAALRIVIGEGEGQNWWCVMYPPLCLDAALSDAEDDYTSEETALVSKGGYKVKFKLLEVTSAIFKEFQR